MILGESPVAKVPSPSVRGHGVGSVYWHQALGIPSVPSRNGHVALRVPLGEAPWGECVPAGFPPLAGAGTARVEVTGHCSPEGVGREGRPCTGRVPAPAGTAQESQR